MNMSFLCRKILEGADVSAVADSCISEDWKARDAAQTLFYDALDLLSMDWGGDGMSPEELDAAWEEDLKNYRRKFLPTVTDPAKKLVAVEFADKFERAAFGGMDIRGFSISDFEDAFPDIAS